ncbi:MAG: MFS transporter [Acidiferrobacter sp.]
MARNTFRSLKVFNFRVWAIGALVSNVGTWMQRTAQDWLVLTELTHHNGTAVGIVMGLQFAPQFFLLPWTGFFADYYNRRKLLIATQTVMGILALALGILTVAGIVQLWQVYVFAFLSGCASAFDSPVRQTFVAELVGDADLPNAVALNSTSFTAAAMVGPAIAGLVIAAVGTGWAFLLNGASFIAVLASLFLLRTHDLHANIRVPQSKSGFAAGLRYVWSRPDLRAIIVMLLLFGMFGLNFQILVSITAVSVFHTNARGYGILSSVMAIGAVLGALIAASGDRTGFMSLLIGAVVFGLGCMMAAVAPDYAVFAVALAIIGLATMTFTNATNSLMQLTTEPAMRGRVMALRVGVALGGSSIGAPIVGWLANHFGARIALGVVSASGIAAAIVAIYAMKQRLHLPRRGELPTEKE